MRRRGFTLIELMIVVTITGLLTTAIGAFYLEHRVGAARIEMQVRLQREASLAAEVIARDLRGASRVEIGGGATTITSPRGVVSYRVSDGVLIRSEGGEDWVLSRHAERLRLEPWAESGWRVRIDVAKELLPGRRIAFERDVVVRRTLP